MSLEDNRHIPQPILGKFVQQIPKKKLMSDKIETILHSLSNKATLKQKVYGHTLDVFNQLKTCAFEVQNTLAPKVLKTTDIVEIKLNDYGDFEFHLKFSGDTIVFIMHTNVFAFSPNHDLNTTEYVKSNSMRGYFGMIQIYNFLSDSIRYNRLADEGYLLGRIFVNIEKHFYVEGRRKLGFVYGNLEKQEVSNEHLRNIIEQCMIYCLDFDLYVPPTDTLEIITVQQKNYFNNLAGISTGKRLGFKVVDQAKLDK
jgi:hypothetical protein